MQMADATPLGELVELVMGQAPSSKDCNFEGRGTPFVKVGEFRELRPVIREWTTNPLRMARKTDVLLCVVGATCGKINLGEDCAIGRSVAAIRPNISKLDQLYLHYFMMTLVERMRSGSVGAAQTVISKAMIENIQIPLPPIPEQRRLVDILDEAFEGIATAKANAERNLQNAREIFESQLQTVFTQRGPEWVETKLGEAYDVRDGTHDSPKYHATGYPLITSKNLKRGGLSFDNVKLISHQDYTKINERSAVHKGDVLLAMIGTIGNPTLVEVEPNFAIKNVALFKNPNGHSSAFLKYYLGSSMVITKMMKDAKGTTQKFVGLGYLRDFPINLPPLAAQLKIVEKLDELWEEAQGLASLYDRKLAALDDLKKSVLHQAFSGQL